ncbi:prolyl oligopeptidase family serine peptidase [bacterium]|nr:prolyl oligopeptidase family serine peptidase [bacterium]
MFSKIQIVQNKDKFNNHLFSFVLFCLTITIFLYFSSVEAYSLKESNGNQKSKPIPITFNSEGSKIQGIFYPANINKLAPTVILLHGSPGNDKEPLGLGTKMMQEGINALAFNYRGTWASEGFHSPKNSLQDVNSAIAFLLSPNIINEFSIDTTNLFIAGYSYGGNMALIGSLNNPSIKKVISIAGADLSEIARSIKNDENFRMYFENMIEERMLNSGMVRSHGGKAVAEELLSAMDQYDYVKYSKELAKKDILLIGGWLDKQSTLEGHILPLYRALQKNEAKNIEIEMFNDNHSFRNVRDALANTIISWIKKKTLD